MFKVLQLSTPIIYNYKNYNYCRKFVRQIQNVGLNDIPKISVSDIRKIMRQKGLAVQEGFTSLTTKCTLCLGEDNKSDSRVYINKTTGKYFGPKLKLYMILFCKTIIFNKWTQEFGPKSIY